MLAAPAIALLGTRVTAAAATAATLAFRPAAAIAASIPAIRTVLLRRRDRRRGNRLAFFGEARTGFANLVFVSGGLIGRLLLLRAALLVLLRPMTRLLLLP